MPSRQAFAGWSAVLAALVLLCLSFTSAQEPARPRAATTRQPAPNREPATLLPADPILYIGWEGQATYRDAWEKTAAYEALYASGLMTVAEQMFKGLNSQTSNEQQALLGELAAMAGKNGASLAVTTPEADGPALPWGVAVLHGGAALEPKIRAAVRGMIRPESGATLRTQQRAGRRIETISFQQFPPAEIGWWTDGGHLVVAAGVGAIDNALAVADGKAANVTTSRLWKAYRTGDQAFAAHQVAWFDVERLIEAAGPIPLPLGGRDQEPVTVAELAGSIGIASTRAIVFRSGFDGPATVTEIRAEMTPEHSGVSELAFQKPLTLDSLPPLPAGLKGFKAASFDFSKFFEVLDGTVRAVLQLGPPGVEQQIDVGLEQARAVTGLDLKTDLFDPLGNVFCVYNDSSQGPLILGLTLAISMDDAAKLRRSLDTLLERIQQQVPSEQFNVRRSQKHGWTVLTLEIADAVANPSLVVTDDWLVVSVVPQTIETFLLRVDGKLPTWSADDDLARSFEELPNQFTALSVSDPKESYRFLAGLAPIALPIIRKIAKTENPDLSLEAAVADLPPAELVVEPLFPNVSVTYLDGDTLVMRSRASLPGLFGGDSGSVGIATTAVAVALLLPAVQAARTAAGRTQSKNNLRQIVLGLHNYHDKEGQFPARTVASSGRNPEDRLSWMASLLPHIEQNATYNQLEQNRAWNQGNNKEAAAIPIPTFVNPAIPQQPRDDAAPTHYVGIGGVGKDAPTLPVTHPKAGIFGYDRTTRMRDIRDGTSNTLMVSEATADSAGAWAQGGKSTIRAFTTKPYVNGPDGIGGPYPGGFNAPLADGSVRFLSEQTDPRVLEAIATMNGREDVTLPE